MIREVRTDDAKDILYIYSYYVKNTAISFEISIPTINEFENRIEKISKDYPYIVYEENNRILGYAYAYKLGEREAYKISASLSIYVDKDSKKKGIGKKLYNEIEKRLKDMGIKNLYSLVVFPPCKTKYLDTNSYDFHRHLGFTEVGHLNKCGMKFGEYFDIVYMEKILGVSTK